MAERQSKERIYKEGKLLISSLVTASCQNKKSGLNISEKALGLMFLALHCRENHVWEKNQPLVLDSSVKFNSVAYSSLPHDSRHTERDGLALPSSQGN